jgi:hypothetical protein
MCSACGKRLFDAECYHMPGDALPDGRKVEAIVTRAEGLEVSAVTVAGVEGTGVQDVRAVLSAGRLEMARPRPMPSCVLAALGLDSGATDTQAIGAAQRLQAELASALAEAERLKIAERETFVDGLIEQAYRDGKLMLKHIERAGSIVRVPHELESLIRTIAADSRDSALAFVGGLPRVVPVGPSLIGSDPSPRARLDETQRSVNRALGLTDETFLKFNEPERADREFGQTSHRK